MFDLDLADLERLDSFDLDPFDFRCDDTMRLHARCGSSFSS